MKETRRLLKVIHELRRKCPWDRKQTHKSLIPYLLEEAHETIEAIEEKNDEKFKEELGDLLLQVVLHTEIARERKKFSFEDVARSLTEKMIRRHPHIYKKAKIKDVKSQLKNWSKLKYEEEPQRSLLGGVPKMLPALQLSQRYGEIAASVGFDWPGAKEVLVKVKEEMSEFERELKRKRRNQDDVEMEFGDLLFTLTRLAGHLNIDAERSLRKSAAKFAHRFGKLELEKKAQNKKLTDFTLAELESAWQRVKRGRE